MAAYASIRPAMRRTATEALAFLQPGRALPVSPALPRGEGRTVLVLPVTGRGDAHAGPMRAALGALGYRAFGWTLGIDVGPIPRLLAGLDGRLAALHAAHGALDVVGLSLGGVFARLLAHRLPGKVRQVATICSPFRDTVDSAFLPVRPFLRVWRTPNLLDLAAKAAQPLPVPGMFVFSRNDGIVAWRRCVEPCQPEDCFEIDGPHVTMARDPDVLAILARRLARDLPG